MNTMTLNQATKTDTFFQSELGWFVPPARKENHPDAGTTNVHFLRSTDHYDIDDLMAPDSFVIVESENPIELAQKINTATWLTENEWEDNHNLPLRAYIDLWTQTSANKLYDQLLHLSSLKKGHSLSKDRLLSSMSLLSELSNICDNIHIHSCVEDDEITFELFFETGWATVIHAEHNYLTMSTKDGDGNLKISQSSSDLLDGAPPLIEAINKFI